MLMLDIITAHDFWKSSPFFVWNVMQLMNSSLAVGSRIPIIFGLMCDYEWFVSTISIPLSESNQTKSKRMCYQILMEWDNFILGLGSHQDCPNRETSWHGLKKELEFQNV